MYWYLHLKISLQNDRNTFGYRAAKVVARRALMECMPSTVVA